MFLDSNMSYSTQAPQTRISKRVHINKHPEATPRKNLVLVLLQVLQVLLALEAVLRVLVLLEILQVLNAVPQVL